VQDIRWVQIHDLSWHGIRDEGNGSTRTFCGRVLVADASKERDTLPAEASCEVCLRSVARAADPGPDTERPEA
jgi:hypothetical protein